MSSDGVLEAEDLDRAQFVQMEEIQPRNAEDILDTVSDNSSEVLETCVVDDGDYEECLIEDDVSTIGSMVSVQSEDVGRIELIIPEVLDMEQEDSEGDQANKMEEEYLEDTDDHDPHLIDPNDPDLIGPDDPDLDVLNRPEDPDETTQDAEDIQDFKVIQNPQAVHDIDDAQSLKTSQDLIVIRHSGVIQGTDAMAEAAHPGYKATEAKAATISKPPNSWPTLEILPGGVINNIAEKVAKKAPKKPASNKMMYACAKCTQSFRHLFCLVKHVKWHEDEDKKLRALLTPIIRKPVMPKRTSNDIEMTLTKQKIKASTEAAKDIKKHTVRHTVKKRNKRVPKKT